MIAGRDANSLATKNTRCQDEVMLRNGSNPVCGICAFLGLAAWTLNAPGQQTWQNPQEIVVDGECRIHASWITGGSPKAFHDRGICSVDPEHYSERDETTLTAGKKRFSVVTIGEHTFYLHNPAQSAVTFIVNQRLGKNWQVDSEPPPNELHDRTATFRVIAQPGQTVELHVGERTPPAH